MSAARRHASANSGQRSTVRVGLVCYGLDRPMSGTTRVAFELGHALHETPGVEVTYLTPYRRGPFRDASHGSFYLPGCRLLPGLMALGGPLTALAARACRLDVVHDPVGASPFTLGRWAGRFRRVLAVHDAIAFRYPEGYPWLNNVLHRRFVPGTLPNVDAIIADSEAGRDDVERFLPWTQAQIAVVPLGVDRRFTPVPSGRAHAVARRYGVTPPYVLSLGSQQARKSVPRAVAAFAALRDTFPHHSLAIAGPRQWAFQGVSQAIQQHRLESRVVTIGVVADVDLPALLSGADAFLFPSLYEGFGLPVLEALACGVPVVCSDTTSLPEVAGDAAVLVDPLSVDSIASGLQRAVADQALRAVLRQRGPARAATFTWQRAAQETAEVYRRALDG